MTLFEALVIMSMQIESLEELDIFCLGMLHVSNADRVVLRLRVLVNLKLGIGSLGHRVDEGEVHCVSSCVLIESFFAWPFVR